MSTLFLLRVLPLELVLQTVGANSGSQDDPRLCTIGRFYYLSRAPPTTPEWFHADEIPHVVVFIEILDAVHRTTPPDADLICFALGHSPNAPTTAPKARALAQATAALAR